MKFKSIILVVLLAIAFFSCDDNDDVKNAEPHLVMRFKFDATQPRLNNLGQPAAIAEGNAAQSPSFNAISSHYMELAPNANTALGMGTILYHAPETMAGGAKAIDFSQSKIVGENEIFLSIPLSQVATGSYEWIRTSLSYQNYDINILHQGTDYAGTLASFVGFKTYLTTHHIGNSSFPVNGNREQGYWALSVNGMPFSGQTESGATTVPNPLYATSPIPPKSCVVTGRFATPLVITGNETHDVEVTLSLSVNNSFEWKEVHVDGKYEPSAGENVVDMGLRGLVPTYQK